MLDYLTDSCELGLQLKIRAATTEAEAWGILKTTYEGQTRIHLISVHANLMHLKYDDTKDGLLADHINKFEAYWLKRAQAVQVVQAGHSTKDSLAEDIHPLTTSDAWISYQHYRESSPTPTSLITSHQRKTSLATRE